MQIRGDYEKFVHKCIAELPETIDFGVAWDIGAHHGYFSKLLAQKFKMVVAFEPDPGNLVELRKNTFNTENVVIIPCAIADRTGLGLLYEGDNDTGHSMIHGGLGRKSYWTPLMTIDDFVLEYKAIPSFIKMDIEGMERFVWTFARMLLEAARPLRIVLETHGTKDAMGWKNGHDPLLESLYELFVQNRFAIFDEKGPVEKFEPEKHYLIVR